MKETNSLGITDRFSDRHIGPDSEDVASMLKALGQPSVDALISSTVPNRIRMKQSLDIGKPRSEFEALKDLKGIAGQNQVFRSYIGMGYNGTITPPVIQRNILENPGWYTQYTPYQAEIAQGRLEALLNFQTMVIDLTGLPIANASLLDEATAAAEAMTMCLAAYKTANPSVDSIPAFFISKDCHPQTISVVQTRAEPLGIKVIVGDIKAYDHENPCFGVVVQYPTTDGNIFDYTVFSEKLRNKGTALCVSADILSLTILKSPAEFGADIAFGSTQRFGVPMGFGGPHAAYLSCKDEFKRTIPGRIIGLSQDTEGRPAARLALQTREQHIRREKATSNICTSQVLLAVISSMYAAYHGPKGLKKIAERIHLATKVLATGLEKLGHKLETRNFFDTLTFTIGGSVSEKDISAGCTTKQINFRTRGAGRYSVSLDETVLPSDLTDILEILNGSRKLPFTIDQLLSEVSTSQIGIGEGFKRKTSYLTHPIFNSNHSETSMLRYIRKLEGRDLSLTHSMIALGSCTMKLNATSEMFPVTWPEFGALHPFAPKEQTAGYQTLFKQLEGWLGNITGFDGISLQPNAGSQGEYAGLLAIRKYHQSRNEGHRNICLIPKSAHGTNPASAVMAGMQVVVVDCDNDGNVNLEDLRKKAQLHSKNLSCAMITYPSTHGVFEETITDFCEVIHSNGGQVYMDGANMNAQVGLCRPGDFGPDVCHLNLHKTFCIPHGGGGPGMGPIGVKRHLVPFLPSHPVVKPTDSNSSYVVSAAPWGSASILPISWMYIAMMGSDGLKKATEIAILNANYVSKRLEPHYPILYKGKAGLVAHECIIDLRKIKEQTGVDVEDVAKRLMDYGFHAPTVSFPVAGTIMIEPTESESLEELDRFCETMISIRNEIKEIETGSSDKINNVLKNAPHTADQVMRSEWNRPYTREKAAYPAPWVRERKFWPYVSRINGVLGDRNLICTCAPIDSYT